MTLVTSVLGILGTYVLSLYMVPNKVIHKPESMHTDFLSGSIADHKNITWSTWHKTMNSKGMSGLDIGSLRAFNLALIAKCWWHFKDRTYMMWNKVIMSTYGDHGGVGVV